MDHFLDERLKGLKMLATSRFADDERAGPAS